MKTQSFRMVPLALGLLSFGACTLSPEVDPEVAALAHSLAPEARVPEAVYQADREALQLTLREDASHRMVLDLTQPAHFRFVLGRLERQGKSPEANPELYALLAKIRAGEVPLAQELPEASEQQSLTDGSTITIEAPTCNVLALSSQKANLNSAGQTVSSTYTMWSQGSCVGGMEYYYLDQQVSSFPVSQPWNTTQVYSNYLENFWDGSVFVALPSFSQTITPANGLLQTSLGLFMLPDGDYLAIYVDDNLYSPMCSVTVQSPRDITGDKTLVVCHNRSGGNCDQLSSGDANYLNLQTEATFTYTVAGNTGAKLSNLSRVQVDIFKPGSGQACYTKVDAPTATSTDGKTIKVKYNPLKFSNACLGKSSSNDSMNSVRLNFKIQGEGSAGICLADNPMDTSTGMPVYFVTGCLKGDSLITLASGEKVALESLVQRHRRGEDLVLLGDRGRPVRLSGAVEGPDSTLIRVTDDLGRVLDASPTHPFLGIEGSVPAETLKVGDFVQTEDGLRPLASVERIAFAGKTYNLTLIGLDGSNLRNDESTFVANGFVVGDFKVQEGIEAQPENRPAPVRTRSDWKAFGEKWGK